MFQGILDAFNVGAQKPGLPRRIRYVSFKVENDQVAKALYDWHANREAAKEQIQAFVKENFTLPLMRRECPFYTLDEHGLLQYVAYTGAIPPGWSGVPNTHWLEPQTPEAVRQIESLPQAPTLKQLHDLINWPTLEKEWFHRNEYETIERINHMVEPFGDDTGTYINVPHPDNFSDFPRIQGMLQNWEKPEWLTNPQDEIPQAPQP